MEQMALWLQRHEAVWLQMSYLTWIEGGLGVAAAEKDKDNDGDDIIDDDQNQLDVSTNKQADSELDSHYSVAKQPPYQNLTVDNILLKFGAIDFISTLSTFLRNTFPGTTVLPSIYDQFDVYKQLVVHLPHNRYLSEQKQWTDRIRTSPFIKANGRSPEKPSRFDTALVVEDSQLYRSYGGIAGEFFLPNKFFYFLIYS